MDSNTINHNRNKVEYAEMMAYLLFCEHRKKKWKNRIAYFPTLNKYTLRVYVTCLKGLITAVMSYFVC